MRTCGVRMRGFDGIRGHVRDLEATSTKRTSHCQHIKKEQAHIVTSCLQPLISQQSIFQLSSVINPWQLHVGPIVICVMYYMLIHLYLATH